MIRKQIAGLVAVFVILAIFMPTVSQAFANIYTRSVGGGSTQTVCYNGFVPCGKTVYLDASIVNGKCDSGSGTTVISCQFCHFFVMLDGIIKFTLIDIVPYLAALMIVVGGAMFYLGGANPSMVTKGKNTLKGVVIGLFLIYGSYMIVALFLTILGATSASGLSDWAGALFKPTHFSIKCGF